MPHARVLPSLRRGQLCPGALEITVSCSFTPASGLVTPLASYLCQDSVGVLVFPHGEKPTVQGMQAALSHTSRLKMGLLGCFTSQMSDPDRPAGAHLLGPRCPWVEVQATSLREQTIPAPRWVHAEPRSVT